jgi:hypothetical protein
MEENDQIANGKPTKAQRLLGTSDFGRIDSKQKRPKITRALRAKPSLSISVSELSQDLAMSGDGIHDHADAAGRPRTPCRSLKGNLSSPSSPLLGQHYHYTSAVTNNRTDLLHSGLRESRSSSTLRSYYDPIKSPLSITTNVGIISKGHGAAQRLHNDREVAGPLQIRNRFDPCCWSQKSYANLWRRGSKETTTAARFLKASPGLKQAMVFCCLHTE